MKQRIILLGFLSHFPVAGVAWQTIHYLVGFRRLGYEVYYVEAHGCTPSKLMRHARDDGPQRAAAYIERILRVFDFAGHWAYVAPGEPGRVFGMSAGRLRDLYQSAACIINLHGSHIPDEEIAATNRLVYLGTDPVDIEIEVHQQRKQTIDYLAPHSAFFTFGENLGRPGCLVPKPDPFLFRPTRQPVVLDFWESHGAGPAEVFTTVGNWRQPGRPVTVGGETLRWSKHLEFLKFIDLPERTGKPFELALSSYTEEDQRLLESRGWRVRNALDVSADIDDYRAYLAGSRGEFTVAKEQNVRLRSGWFSDRAATYLAAGRPVITQETGFSHVLPTGAGLFAFTSIDDILRATEEIERDYEYQRRSAWALARECFHYEVVLGRLLDELGLPRGPVRLPARPHPPFSEWVITPVSRWPTRLPEETLAAAMRLPVPPAFDPAPVQGLRLSVVMVTHQGEPFTRMCLHSLLTRAWREGDELIVVDNASTDGTRAYLRAVAQRHPFVRVVANGHNAGFAAANNQALAAATGDAVVFLNNDTLLPHGWRERLLRHLDDPAVGMAGPVTNHTCNEAQVDAPYRTVAEFETFARHRAREHEGLVTDIRMLAFFCTAIRRDVLDAVGPLDEQFEVGMFEDDDYAHRVRQAGYRIVCAEDVFVHHFGQASLGALCSSGRYDDLLESNRRRFEEKWGEAWKPHGRRVSEAYRSLRLRVKEQTAAATPPGSTVLLISKGDNDLVDLPGRSGWHFPRSADGACADHYPSDSAEAIEHLEQLHAAGATHFAIPQPYRWWMEHYRGLHDHLEQHYRRTGEPGDAVVIYDLEAGHG